MGRCCEINTTEATPLQWVQFDKTNATDVSSPTDISSPAVEKVEPARTYAPIWHSTRDDDDTYKRKHEKNTPRQKAFLQKAFLPEEIAKDYI